MMKLLEQRIQQDGVVLPGNVLKVGNFLNQQLDTEFLLKLGEEIARLYADDHVTKILTVESSGIALAFAAGVYLHAPVVFAKKKKSANQSAEVYWATVKSYTHGDVNDITVAKEYLSAEDRILIVDDFLAMGEALRGLIAITNAAHAHLVGCSTAIEKGFQHGGDDLRAAGIRVESLAIIESMSEKGIVYR